MVGIIIVFFLKNKTTHTVVQSIVLSISKQ